MFEKFYLNARKPKGLGGRLILARMNRFGHARLSEWGFGLLSNAYDLQSAQKVMDIGCGGGANIARLLNRCPTAVVFGLDYSPISVDKSIKHNKSAVKKGRCIVKQGDVTDIPFNDNEFELITAFETVYFWKPVEKAFSEVLRILKPGGKFFVCNDFGGKEWQPDKRFEMLDMTVFDVDLLRKTLSEAGFSQVEIHTTENEGWICAIAVK